MLNRSPPSNTLNVRRVHIYIYFIVVMTAPYAFQVQQSLATPGTLERFVKDSEKAVEIRKIFTGLYALDLVSS